MIIRRIASFAWFLYINSIHASPIPTTTTSSFDPQSPHHVQKSHIFDLPPNVLESIFESPHLSLKDRLSAFSATRQWLHGNPSDRGQLLIGRQNETMASKITSIVNDIREYCDPVDQSLYTSLVHPDHLPERTKNNLYFRSYDNIHDPEYVLEHVINGDFATDKYACYEKVFKNWNKGFGHIQKIVISDLIDKHIFYRVAIGLAEAIDPGAIGGDYLNQLNETMNGLSTQIKRVAHHLAKTVLSRSSVETLVFSVPHNAKWSLMELEELLDVAGIMESDIEGLDLALPRIRNILVRMNMVLHAYLLEELNQNMAALNRQNTFVNFELNLPSWELPGPQDANDTILDMLLQVFDTSTLDVRNPAVFEQELGAFLSNFKRLNRFTLRLIDGSTFISSQEKLANALRWENTLHGLAKSNIDTFEFFWIQDSDPSNMQILRPTTSATTGREQVNSAGLAFFQRLSNAIKSNPRISTVRFQTSIIDQSNILTDTLFNLVCENHLTNIEYYMEWSTPEQRQKIRHCLSLRKSALLGFGFQYDEDVGGGNNRTFAQENSITSIWKPLAELGLRTGQRLEYLRASLGEKNCLDSDCASIMTQYFLPLLTGPHLSKVRLTFEHFDSERASALAFYTISTLLAANRNIKEIAFSYYYINEHVISSLSNLILQATSLKKLDMGIWRYKLSDDEGISLHNSDAMEVDIVDNGVNNNNRIYPEDRLEEIWSAFIIERSNGEMVAHEPLKQKGFKYLDYLWSLLQYHVAMRGTAAAALQEVMYTPEERDVTKKISEVFSPLFGEKGNEGFRINGLSLGELHHTE